MKYLILVKKKCFAWNYHRWTLNHLTCLMSPRLERLKEEVSSDATLKSLYETVLKGWPLDRALLPADLWPYWSFRDEISIDNGVLLKSHQVIIPPSMRQEMLNKIHKAHQGADSSIRRARETLFWPGMSAAIRQTCSSCGLCAHYKSERPTEPMKSQEIPTLPWERISVDLFQLDGKTYLVTVDHYSDFIEIDWLKNTSAMAVINAMKKNFARAGIPCACVSDNGHSSVVMSTANLPVNMDSNQLSRRLVIAKATETQNLW